MAEKWYAYNKTLATLNRAENDWKSAQDDRIKSIDRAEDEWNRAEDDWIQARKIVVDEPKGAQ